MLTRGALELLNEIVHIAEHPHRRDPIRSECEQRHSGISDRPAGGRDAEHLALVGPTVREPNGRPIPLAHDILALVVEVGKSCVDEVDVLTKLSAAVLLLTSDPRNSMSSVSSWSKSDLSNRFHIS
jgi:hypothetical protein